jgi:hypothetical protein
MRTIAPLLSLLVGITAYAPAAQQRTVHEGGFGYVNADGSELIALDSLAHPHRVQAAICSRARVFRVAYTRWQTKRPGDTGRQVASNFPNEAGEVFRVAGAKAPVNETCYLSPDSALVASVAPVNTRERTGCDPARLRRIAATKQRAVVHCWPLASAPRDIQIIAVQFALVDTSALASLVVADPPRLVFQDFPATYRGEGESTWRVDDGGIFSPENFDILFFCRLRGTYVMALTWAGAEGEDAYLATADSADSFRTTADTYRYWVPQ